MMTTALQALKVQASLPRLNQDLLNRALDAHERFIRREPGGRRAVIPFLQAPGLDFSRRLLSDVEFRGGNLQRARLISADLQRASLYCADLRGADIRNANLSRADIRGASMRQANLSGAILNDADLREGRLVQLDVPEGFRSVGKSGLGAGAEEVSCSVDFTNCSMKGVKLANSKLKGANFSGALLHNADFAGANISGCNFDGAVLIGVDLKQCRFDPGALSKSVVDPSPVALGRAPELLNRITSAAHWVETDGQHDRAANLDGEDLRPLAGAFVNRQATGRQLRGRRPARGRLHRCGPARRQLPGREALVCSVQQGRCATAVIGQRQFARDRSHRGPVFPRLFRRQRPGLTRQTRRTNPPPRSLRPTARRSWRSRLTAEPGKTAWPPRRPCRRSDRIGVDGSSHRRLAQSPVSPRPARAGL
jgi:uncharacterized protein YjbI with pentapeptide repeats